MARWNPLSGLERPGAVAGWAMFDLANQSFTLLINTLLFSVYYAKVVDDGSKGADSRWGLIAAASLAFVVIASPILGAIADERRVKKPMLLGSAVVCVGFTVGLALLGRGDVWLAAALYIPANFAFAVGENFLGAFLPEIARRQEVGRVSAIGWTLGYVGALVMLVAVWVVMRTRGMDDPGTWRPFFVAAGVWFFVMALPTAFLLRERSSTVSSGSGLARRALGRLVRTGREARTFKDLSRFLVAFVVYQSGVQTLVFFAALIATDFGFAGASLAGFMLPITVLAGVGAVITGKWQDRLGHRRMIGLLLGVWGLTALLLVGMPIATLGGVSRPGWLLWVIGCGMGLGLGGIGTASRAMVGYLTPTGRTAEFFGIWGLSTRLAAILGLVGFGQVRAIVGRVASAPIGDLAAYGLLLVVFAVGWMLLRRVDERRGHEAASRADGGA